jgi:hypothetical protein
MDFDVVADAPNLLNPVDALALAKQMATNKPAVIVIDTLSAVTPGANENAGEDMGTAIAHCKGLHRLTGALVILIHHSGKDATKGARGWSGLRAAADCEIEVTRFEEYRQARVSKMKDGDEGDEFAFKLVPVLLGIDGEGEDISSCVVEAMAPRKPETRRKLGAVESEILASLSAMISIENGGDSVATEDLIEAVKKRLVFDAGSGTRDQRRTTVKRAIQSMVQSGILDFADGRVKQALHAT